MIIFILNITFFSPNILHAAVITVITVISFRQHRMS